MQSAQAAIKSIVSGLLLAFVCAGAQARLERLRLVAASDIVIRAPGQEVVNSGTLYAHGGSSGSAGAIAIQANNVINSGTLAGQWVGIKADQDILNTNGQIIGLGSTGKPSVIALQAGRNIELRTTTQDLQYTEGPATATASLAGRIATLSGDQISLQAGQDLIAQGAKIKAGDILLASAGRNVDIGATVQRRTTDVRLAWATAAGMPSAPRWRPSSA